MSSESTDDKPAVPQWDVGDLGQREGWAEYLSEIDVGLPGRKAAAGQPAAAELSACGQRLHQNLRSV